MKTENPDRSSDLMRARNVTKEYRIGAGTVSVLKNVSVGFRPGEAVAIVGASGSGKSTLLNVLGGLDRPTSGEVFFDERNLYNLSAGERGRLRARRIGFIFQAYHLISELTVHENVLLSSMSGRGATRKSAEMRSRASELLCRVGLGDRMHHRPDEISGGEQQRVAIARALINDPDLVLADEPTGNLDTATGEKILDDLFSLVHDQRRSVLLVTHNAALAARCDRRMELRDGILSGNPI